MRELSLPLGELNTGLLARVASSLKSVRSEMGARHTGGVIWPAPAGYRLADRPDPSFPDKAVIHLLDGQVLHGWLERFRPGATGLKLRVQLTGDTAAILLSRVKKITLPDPVSMVEEDGRDAEKLRFGTVVEFRMRFSDREVWEAETKSSIRSPEGTFLFTTEGRHSSFTGNARQTVIRHFVPAFAVLTLRLGAEDGTRTAEFRSGDARPALPADLQPTVQSANPGEDPEPHDPDVLERLCRGQTGALRLGDALVDLGLVSAQDLAEALRIQAESNMQRRIGSILVERFGLKEETLQRALLRQLGIPFISLGKLRARSETVERIPRAVALARGCAVLHENPGCAYLAMSNPLDEDTIQTCRFMLQKRIEVVVASKTDITAFLARHIKRAGAGLSPKDFFN